MKLRIRNNSTAPQGVKRVSGGYAFIQPGKERVVDAVNPDIVYRHDFLDVEALESQVPEMPQQLAAKVSGASKPKAPAKPVRRRRKAASK